MTRHTVLKCWSSAYVEVEITSDSNKLREMENRSIRKMTSAKHVLMYMLNKEVQRKFIVWETKIPRIICLGREEKYGKEEHILKYIDI